jgi:hypothetical protein
MFLTFTKKTSPIYSATPGFLKSCQESLSLCAPTSLKGKPTGIEFIDSTSIKVCHNIRIPRHKTFDGIAQRGKGTIGWFYGFKLHLIVNYQGEIVAAKVTTGNVHDTQPVTELAQGLTDKLYGDKGYLSKALAANLFEKGVTLVTTVRKNMKAKAISLWDRAMLSKRYIIGTINDQLKNISYRTLKTSQYEWFYVEFIGRISGLLPKKE